MADHPLFDRVDEAIQTMLATGERPDDRELAPYVRIAQSLRDLPRPSFRARLKAELQRRTTMPTSSELTTGVPTITHPAPTVTERAASEPRSALNQTATPRMRVKNAAAAIEFYKQAFGARELMRFEAEGSIAHAELAIGNSIVMLSEAAPQYGFPGPDAFGGSPVGMHLYVDDADRWVERAVAAGARVVRPVVDEFYGDRAGTVADPYGYSWTVATHKVDMSVEEMQRRLAAMMGQARPKDTANFQRKGYNTVTPYLVVKDAPALIEFTKRVFGAEELMRTSGSAGGIHAEVRLGDSVVMIGGGGEGYTSPQAVMPTALHVYVRNVDEVYRRAIEAGGSSISEPTDQPYGERGSGVRDAEGNYWYIATATGDHYIQPGMHNVNVYLHPKRAEPVMKFLERGLGAVDPQKYASPEGVVFHATVKLGDSVIEMGEAHEQYGSMPTMFYLYVADVDASYIRALQAGGASIQPPANQDYGDRTAAVKDPFGNQWYFATVLKVEAGPDDQ